MCMFLPLDGEALRCAGLGREALGAFYLLIYLEPFSGSRSVDTVSFKH